MPKNMFLASLAFKKVLLYVVKVNYQLYNNIMQYNIIFINIVYVNVIIDYSSLCRNNRCVAKNVCDFLLREKLKRKYIQGAPKRTLFF
jgi:hypothetical protein